MLIAPGGPQRPHHPGRHRRADPPANHRSRPGTISPEASPAVAQGKSSEPKTQVQRSFFALLGVSEVPPPARRWGLASSAASTCPARRRGTPVLLRRTSARPRRCRRDWVQKSPTGRNSRCRRRCSGTGSRRLIPTGRYSSDSQIAKERWGFLATRSGAASARRIRWRCMRWQDSPPGPKDPKPGAAR